MEMSSKNLQEIEVNTFQRPIPEINRLKFPKYDLILPWYRGYQTNCSEMSLISLKSSISQLFKTASHIFIEMLCEILEHYKHFHFPATNCIFKQYLLTRSLYTLGVPFYRLVRRVVLVKKNVKNKTCSIFDKTLSKVFLNNFHALNRS